MFGDDVENVTAPNDVTTRPRLLLVSDRAQDAWKYGNPELDSNDPSSIYRNP